VRCLSQPCAVLRGFRARRLSNLAPPQRLATSERGPFPPDTGLRPQESAAHAASVFQKAYLREGVHPGTLVLHSDNGSPMKGATMLVMLQRLGVVPSFSRPAVSNDNPYSESLFNTVKGRPDFPSIPSTASRRHAAG
jgi:transposase InsO family protein